jgi:hypothetical protein
MFIKAMRGRVSIDVRKFFELWASTALRNDEIAETLGITRGQLFIVAKRLAAPQRPRSLSAPSNGMTKDDPTLDEIAERSAIIRDSWTPEERERRAVGGRMLNWRAPAYRVGGGCGRSLEFVRTYE